MKKLILSLALAAFIGGGTLATAMTNTESVSNTETIQMIQDGKKKATATKKDECKDAKKSDCKTKCDDKKVTKKSCCSDGKAAKTTKSNPEKK